MTHERFRPGVAEPEEWKKDLNPDFLAGENYGVLGPQPEKAGLTADSIKGLHSRLQGFGDEDLKQITIVPQGSRLAQGATYIDLRDPHPREFTATADMSADSGHWYAPKSEIHYTIWNRLIGVANPERTGKDSD